MITVENSNCSETVTTDSLPIKPLDSNELNLLCEEYLGSYFLVGSKQLFLRDFQTLFKEELEVVHQEVNLFNFHRKKVFVSRVLVSFQKQPSVLGVGIHCSSRKSVDMSYFNLVESLLSVHPEIVMVSRYVKSVWT